ncbi:OmpA family protein [Moraxella bovis]|uniref:OmpA family protein n=1 Tax=Moraxella bovis TaxID=476 RepID=UPI000991AF04|nr:OmpA family protein [Moraxella bovis]OOR89804.1 hypothetical protein B0182_06520 [Moraxella bovis]UZA15839.1 OmpA family protein [Moraxella bovis]
MDIVQYLHGLVSSSMGISNEDTSADLLKQYYALSTARLIELNDGFDSTNAKNHSLTALWGMQAEPLARRLARSFHMDEQSTMTLLKAITPPMMVEVANLAGGQALIAFLAQNFESSRTHLPAWSPQFIQSSLAQKIEQLNGQTPTADSAFINSDNQPNQADDDINNTPIATDDSPIISVTKTANINDNTNTPFDNEKQGENINTNGIYQDGINDGINDSIDNNINDDINTDTTVQDDINDDNHLGGHQPIKPSIKPKVARPNPLLMGLGAGLIALAVGGGAWYLLKDKSDSSETAPVHDPNVATPTVISLNPPRLSLTSGENGTLYACQAEVGNSQLQEQLLGVLQKNFGQIGCIMDIDDNFGTSLTGLERLESIMAMVKSEPFTSIEIIGDHIYVNTPKTDILPRIVNDIALLAPQFTVSPAPALDKANVINQSLERATTALNALDNPPNSYDLSRSASLAVIDFNGTSELPANTHGVLSLLAEKIKANPSIKLIIATHTSGGDSTDRMANLSLSQSQAEAVKAFLVEQGVSDIQLTPKGVGDSFPISDNVTELGRFKNRRTEFLVFDEATMTALNVDMTQLVPAPNTAMSAQSMPMPAPVQQMPMPVQNVPMQNMPVQGMPDGNYLPQPVQNVQPLPEVYPAPAPSGYIGTTPPPAPSASTPALPDDFIELSNATISSEQGRGVEREIR